MAHKKHRAAHRDGAGGGHNHTEHHAATFNHASHISHDPPSRDPDQNTTAKTFAASTRPQPSPLHAEYPPGATSALPSHTDNARLHARYPIPDLSTPRPAAATQTASTPPVAEKPAAPAPPAQTKQTAAPPVSAPASASPSFATAAQDRLIYHVPENIGAIFHDITRNNPAWYTMMVNLLGSESGFKTHIQSKTGATGVGQFTAKTFIERGFKDKGLLPEQYQETLSKIIQHDSAAESEHARVSALIKAGHKDAKEHYVKPEYYYVIAGKTSKERQANRKAVLELRNDPLVSSVAAREYIRETLIDAHIRFLKGIDAKIAHISDPKFYPDPPVERLEKLRQERERPWTVADAKIVYVAGARGGTQILLAAADIATEKHRISDYTAPEVVNGNPDLFTENGKNKNPAQFMDYINQRVGNMRIPENLSRPINVAASPRLGTPAT